MILLCIDCGGGYIVSYLYVFPVIDYYFLQFSKIPGIKIAESANDNSRWFLLRGL